MTAHQDGSESERPAELLAFYREHRVDDQVRFYARRQSLYERATGQAAVLSATLLGFATAAAALAGTPFGPTGRARRPPRRASPLDGPGLRRGHAAAVRRRTGPWLPYAIDSDGAPVDTPAARARLRDRLLAARDESMDSPVFQLVEGFPTRCAPGRPSARADSSTRPSRPTWPVSTPTGATPTRGSMP